MTGTKDGGMKTYKANIERHGEDFYKRIGSKGGSTKTEGRGFASKKVGADGLTGQERARVAGTIGGASSKWVHSDEHRKHHSEKMRAFFARKKQDESSN